jgi:hypothetical protein
MAQRNKLRQREDDREFPVGLVLIGLLLVAIVWVGIFRPNFFDFLPLQAPFNSQKQKPERISPQENAATSPPQVQEMAEEPPSRETASPSTGAESDRGNKGDFFRYTDEYGTIHLVDNPANVPERYRQQTKVYNRQGLITKVRIVKNQVLVPVTLRNGYQEVQATLLLDTGCTMTSISTALASRLGIDPARTRPGSARVADGRNVPSRVAVIGQISIGPMIKQSLEVSIMPMVGPQESADGLLGMNFLGDFRYQIDTANQQIIWH